MFIICERGRRKRWSLCRQGAIPFAFKSVRSKEQQVAEARDNQYAKVGGRASLARIVPLLNVPVHVQLSDEGL